MNGMSQSEPRSKSYPKPLERERHAQEIPSQCEAFCKLESNKIKKTKMAKLRCAQISYPIDTAVQLQKVI